MLYSRPFHSPPEEWIWGNIYNQDRSRGCEGWALNLGTPTIWFEHALLSAVFTVESWNTEKTCNLFFWKNQMVKYRSPWQRQVILKSSQLLRLSIKFLENELTFYSFLSSSYKCKVRWKNDTALPIQNTKQK